jgi:hypothetical protein
MIEESAGQNNPADVSQPPLILALGVDPMATIDEFLITESPESVFEAAAQDLSQSLCCTTSRSTT